jgi:hypothetical protein
MWAQLAIWEFVPLVVLLALWRAPDWVLKVLATAEAVRRFRRCRDDDQGEDVDPFPRSRHGRAPGASEQRNCNTRGRDS